MAVNSINNNNNIPLNNTPIISNYLTVISVKNIELLRYHYDKRFTVPNIPVRGNIRYEIINI